MQVAESAVGHGQGFELSFWLLSALQVLFEFDLGGGGEEKAPEESDEAHVIRLRGQHRLVCVESVTRHRGDGVRHQR